ncbi:MAG: hypothetical protein KA347_06615 [Bacteroidia bacterium]|nr:hypothetical protein [Bacteroidia bacterium]
MTPKLRNQVMISQLESKLKSLKNNLNFMDDGEDKTKLRSDIHRWEVHLCQLHKERDDLKTDKDVMELDLVNGKLGLK